VSDSASGLALVSRRGSGKPSNPAVFYDNKLAAEGEAEEGQKERKAKRDIGIEDGHPRLPFRNSGPIDFSCG